LAINQGLAYPRWGAKPYPADSYPCLAMAIKIDANAALRSASFGLGQIMGFNHKAAGYASPGDMVAAFCDDEAAGLEAMIRFIESEGLDDELRRHDWSAFARGYNGAGYAKHGYHTRLAAAFKRWQAVPDVLAPSYPKVRLGSRGAPVRVAQERLLALGFDPRGVDGIFGAGTRAAAIAFQFSAGLSQDGILGPRPGWPSSRSLYRDQDHRPYLHPEDPQLLARHLPPAADRTRYLFHQPLGRWRRWPAGANARPATRL
jgi:hypothetical protein